MPDPTASVCYATTADYDGFSARWVDWATGLGVDPLGALTVRADWSAWIWSAITEHFSAATQVLDIFHASQHLAGAAAGLLGEATAAAGEWLAAWRDRLRADGWNGLMDRIGATPMQGRTAAGRAALDETVASFAVHTTRVQYLGRLQAGQSIGSGSIEGLACRLKLAVRGWCVEHLDGMAALIATADAPEWAGLWARTRRLTSRFGSYTLKVSSLKKSPRTPCQISTEPITLL